MTFFIGVDPGISGAIAIIYPDGIKVAIADMPRFPRVKGQFSRHDSAALYRSLSQLPSEYSIAVVEQVHFDSRDTNHKGSAEVLIRSHESVLTILSILGIETYNLYPPQWRKLAGSQGLTESKAIVDRALQLFPNMRSELRRRSGRATAGYVYEHNRAEALLMAYASMQLHNEKSKEAIA